MVCAPPRYRLTGPSRDDGSVIRKQNFEAFRARGVRQTLIKCNEIAARVRTRPRQGSGKLERIQRSKRVQAKHAHRPRPYLFRRLNLDPCGTQPVGESEEPGLRP
jgi:hypothetical protein